jgi:hypothetical protein
LTASLKWNHFLAQRAVPHNYKKGEILFTEGDPCTGLFVIESGAFLVAVSFLVICTAPSVAQVQVAISTNPTFLPVNCNAGVFGTDFVMTPGFHNTDDRPSVPLLGDSTVDLFASASIR